MRNVCKIYLQLINRIRGIFQVLFLDIRLFLGSVTLTNLQRESYFEETSLENIHGLGQSTWPASEISSFKVVKRVGEIVGKTRINVFTCILLLENTYS